MSCCNSLSICAIRCAFLQFAFNPCNSVRFRAIRSQSAQFAFNARNSLSIRAIRSRSPKRPQRPQSLHRIAGEHIAAMTPRACASRGLPCAAMGVRAFLLELYMHFLRSKRKRMKLTDFTEGEKRERHKQQQKDWRDNNRGRMQFLVKRWQDHNQERRQAYISKHKQKLQDYKRKAALYDICILDHALAPPVRL